MELVCLHGRKAAVREGAVGSGVGSHGADCGEGNHYLPRRVRGISMEGEQCRANER